MAAKKENVLVAEGEAAYLPSSQNYIVTRDGRIINKYGHELSPYNHNGRPHVTVRINGKRTNLSVARAVYTAFVGVANGRYIIHRNGNNFDCSADNLFAVSSLITNEQRQAYERWALPSVKKFISQKKINSIKGFDVDNFIGEACLYMLKYLSLYKYGKVTFIAWAKKYINWAFINEYKKYKTILAHEIRKEFLF